MDKNLNENILIDFISDEIFEKTWDYEYNAEGRNPVRFMRVNVAGIGDLESIKVGKLNFPGTRGRSYWLAIKHKDRTQFIPSEFLPMAGIANYVANYIGSNLIWIDIYITNNKSKWV
jgi:hypothetical protein